MITFDRSVLKSDYRDAEVEPKLMEFANAVSLAKPRINFVVDDQCIHKEYTANDKKHFLRTLRVFEDGEQLGEIGITRRYSSGAYDLVYKIRSFRIKKERGDANGTMAKDLKVAVRHAKKAFVSREAKELIEQVKNHVDNALAYLESRAQHELTWTLDTYAIATKIALASYDARQKGEESISIDSKVMIDASRLSMHDEKCATYKTVKYLDDLRKSSKGYAVFTRIDNSLIVYSYATNTVKRYDSFEHLPKEIQDKYAMFKVLNKDEAHDNIGCKFEEGYAYVVE